MTPTKYKVLREIFAWSYFFILFFAVFGIRLSPVFNFKVSHGYNLDVFAHLSDLGSVHYNLNMFSRFDWWINVILFLFFPFALCVSIPGARLYKMIIIGTFTSVCIELLQYTFDLGLADINDVIANTLGVVGGCILILLWRKLNKRRP